MIHLNNLLNNPFSTTLINLGNYHMYKFGWKVANQSHCSRTQGLILNLLMPNDDYSGRTAPLTSKCCILYIYSTNIGTDYFKHGIHCQFFPLQNAVCFINLTYMVPVLFTFYIVCAKIKKK